MALLRTLITGLLAGSCLTSCGLHSAFDMDKRDTTQNQLCNRLKRDIVFYSMDQNHDTSWSSPAKQADILREYQENNCEEVLSGAAQSTASASTPFTLPKGKGSNQNHIQVRQES
jgi:hypothetical protein